MSKTADEVTFKMSVDDATYFEEGKEYKLVAIEK